MSTTNEQSVEVEALVSVIEHGISRDTTLDNSTRVQLLGIFNHFTPAECSRLIDVLLFGRYDTKNKKPDLYYLLGRIGLSPSEALERAKLLLRGKLLNEAEKMRLLWLNLRFYGLSPEACDRQLEEKEDRKATNKLIEERREELRLTLPDPTRGPYARQERLITDVLVRYFQA